MPAPGRWPATPLAGHFGALLDGAHVDLRAVHADPVQASALRDTLYQCGLLIVSNQQAMLPADDVAVARIFTHDEKEDHVHASYTGGANPQHKLPDQPEVALVGTYRVKDYFGFSGESSGTYGDASPVRAPTGNLPPAIAWHNDGFADTVPPPDITLMRCIETPDTGGETLFASSVRCAELLLKHRDLFDPPPEQVRVRYQLRKGAERRSSGMALATPGGGARDDVWVNDACGTEHPLLAREPNSGKVTMVGTYHCVGLTSPGRELGFDEANDYVERAWMCGLSPENVIAHQWRPGDVALWSNRLVTHSATSGAAYAGKTRLHHRVRLRAAPGDAPQAAFPTSRVCS